MTLPESELHHIFSEKRISQRSEDLSEYGRDWTRQYDPDPCAVVWPETTEQVVQLIQWARKYRVGLVPSGGRTGLSGGAMACNREIVVSFDRMNQIKGFNPIERTLTCEPGVITAELQQAAMHHELFYPVDFASSGSSQIGGNIATNAGGIKVLKYGLTRDWVVGLKVVTGTGEVLSLNNNLIKNATGYDLRHLMIGSEGTLGLIVEATLKLTDSPKHAQVLVLGVPNLEAIMQVFQLFRSTLDLTAFEFFSDIALNIVLENSSLNRPFADKAPYYVLLETEIDSDSAEQQLMNAFEEGLNTGCIIDGVMSQNDSQFADLWSLRERISESISHWTPYKNDISVSVSQVPAFLKEIDHIVGQDYPNFTIVWFGHIGDGNLHLNILKPEELDKDTFINQCKQVSEKVYQCVAKYQGSISAEHGVGLIKKPALHYSRSSAEMCLMRQLKGIFDPDHILNPGKLLD